MSFSDLWSCFYIRREICGGLVREEDVLKCDYRCPASTASWENLEGDGEPSQSAQFLNMLEILFRVVREDVQVKIGSVVWVEEAEEQLQPLSKERNLLCLLLLLLVGTSEVSETLEEPGPGLLKSI